MVMSSLVQRHCWYLPERTVWEEVGSREVVDVVHHRREAGIEARVLDDVHHRREAVHHRREAVHHRMEAVHHRREADGDGHVLHRREAGIEVRVLDRVGSSLLQLVHLGRP